MSERHEYRKILMAIRALGEVTRDASSSRSPIEDVRAQLLRNAPPRTHSRRIAITSAMAAAAAVLLAVALPLVVNNSPASAAARWQDAARAARAYKGWVHEKTAVTPSAAATKPAGTQPSTPPFWSQPSVRVTHWSTETDLFVREIRLGDRLHVELKIPSKRLWYEYDSTDNELRISEMVELRTVDPAADAKWFAMTLAEFLEASTGPDGKPAAVTEQRDRDLTRFDLSDDRWPAGMRMKIWVDPSTKLIRKKRVEMPEGVMDTEYTYGDPQIRDAYDAGVPRNAVVVDGRPVNNVASVIDRLHRRAMNGYGDGVAVLTKRMVHGREDPLKRADITIFARHGNKGISARYFVMGGQGHLKQRGTARTPEGFPTPSFDQAMAVLADRVPGELHVMNGRETWDGTTTQDLSAIKWLGRNGVAEQNLYLHSVGAIVWPTREYAGMQVPGTKAEILTDPARPGLIGVSCTTGKDRTPGFTIAIDPVQQIFWIDPARDDMPIETLRIENPPPAGQPPKNYSRTIYKQHAQLPDGRWYPTMWEGEGFEDGKPNADGFKIVGHLSLSPDKQLPEDWFAAPGESHFDALK